MAIKEVSIAIGVIVWIITHLIILPYEAYWLFEFWKNRYTLIIKKRKPVLVMIATFCLWIYMSLLTTHSIIHFQVAYQLYQEDNVDVSGGAIIKNTLYPPFFWSYLIIQCARYWLMFYMINYNVAVANNKWQSVIDPKQSLSNWYIQNKTKWGSSKYITKFMIIYGVSIYFVVTFIYFVSIAYHNSDITVFRATNNILIVLIALFLGPVPIIFNVYILCKIPSFNDDIGIRKELGFSIKFISIIIVAFIMFQILDIILSSTAHYGHYSIAMVTNISYLVLRVGFSMGILSSTRWPLITFKEIICGRYSSSRMIALVHQKTYNEIDEETLIMGDEKEVIVLRKEMKNTLQDGRLFDGFMKHLLNEYCAECLLSIIEFTQFKQKIADENKNIVFNETGDLVDSIFKLPDDLVKSSIVYGDISNYSDMAHKLYNKYICIGSEWEININDYCIITLIFATIYNISNRI